MTEFGKLIITFGAAWAVAACIGWMIFYSASGGTDEDDRR